MLDLRLSGMVLHGPILIHVTRHNFSCTFVAATADNGMLHETTFNETCKLRATMLQVFESLSKTCIVFPQQDIALKVTQCERNDIDICVKNRLV